jgi:uncharacterized protein (DUF433 family)
MASSRPAISAFSERHAERLTGVSVRQLRYWHKTKFFVPTAPEAAFGAFYSFRDIVALRTLRRLRHEHHVSLQHLRQVAVKLSELGQDIWRQTTLYLLGRRVVVKKPGEEPVEVLTGQKILSIPLRKVAADTQRDAKELLRRPDNVVGRIGHSTGVADREALIRGTRITVSTIKAYADAGYSPDDIIREYPDLTRDDVAAALAHTEAKRAA